MVRWLDETRNLPDATIGGDEFVRLVDDPSGTPRSGKASLAALKAYFTDQYEAIDTPQFAGINIGHASDTTLTRASAGVVAAEGIPLGFEVGTRAEVATRSIPAAVQVIRTTGYATAGDLGHAAYKRVGAQPSHAGKVQSADGAWWELMPDEQGAVHARQFGLKADNTDETSTLQAFVDYIAARASANNNGLSLTGYLPAGFIRASAISITRPMRLVGAGQDNTYLVQVSGLNTSFVTVRVAHDGNDYWASSNRAARVVLEDMTVSGQGWGAGFAANHGLDLGNAAVNPITTEVVLRSFKLFSFSGNGLHAVSFTGWVTGHEVMVQSAGVDCISATSCADWTFNGLEVTNGRYNVLFSGCVNMHVAQYNCYDGREVGIYLFRGAATSAALSATFTQGSIDRNGRHGVVSDLRAGTGVGAVFVNTAWAINSDDGDNLYSDVYVEQLATQRVALVGCQLRPATANSVDPTHKVRHHIEFHASSTGTVSAGPDVTFEAGFSTNKPAQVERGLRGVERYGAVPSAAVNNGDAFTAMLTAVGHVLVPPGQFGLGTVTLDGPITFEAGGSISAQSGATVTIRGAIDAPRQQVLAGSGSYVFGHDSDSGEDARELHAAWFGIRPLSAVATTNQGPAIQAALDTMGNLREGVLEFDVGNYHIESGITVPRGVHIKGAGTRRTVFRSDVDGFNFFTTNGVACKFSDFQFEFTGALLSASSTNKGIVVNHEDCEVRDVQVRAHMHTGVELNALRALVRDIDVAYGFAGVSGSSIVAVRSQGNARIEGVRAENSSFAPTSLVRIEPTATLSNVHIEDLGSILPCPLVIIDSTAAAVSRVTIDQIAYNQFAGTAPNYVIGILNASGSNNTNDIVISGGYVNGYGPPLLRLEQAGMGTMSDISIDSLSYMGTAALVDIVHNAGGVRDIRIDDTVNARRSTSPFTVSGTSAAPNRLLIGPAARPNGAPPIITFQSMADDTAIAIPLHMSAFSCFVMVSAGSNRFAFAVARAATTPAITSISLSANAAVTTGVLAGTTGTDGNLTVSADARTIYVENRLGSTQNVSVSVFAAALA